jgi:hypothetical protein
VATFIYDKHGTGESSGSFHMNFHRLAGDMVAAAGEARRLAAGRFGRLGLYGISQGGWVAPLAAVQLKPDFMVINTAGVFSPLEEDSGEVFNGLREKGHGDDVIAKAREVVAATHALRASDYRSGHEQLAEVKRKYGAEPWFKDIDGDVTTGMLRATDAELRSQAGQNSMQIPWAHDSVAVLRTFTPRTLWTRAGKDRESPVGLTEERLAMLQKEGKPIDVALFPQADHGLMEFTQAADGSRTYTRFAEGGYRLMIDWIHGRRSPPYGQAVLQGAAR